MALQSTNPELAFQARYLGPRFWGTWLLLLLLRLVMVLPRKWIMVIGAWAGDQFRLRNQKRRRIAEVNLELCFPHWSVDQRQQFMVEHFRAYGRSLIDMGLSIWGSSAKIASLVTTEGLEAHTELLKKRNVMVVTWHLTTLELTANVVTESGPAVSMMNKMDNPLLTWLFGRARTRLSDVALVMRDEGLRAFISHIRPGRQGIIVPDEDIGKGDTGVVFAPFFGAERALLTTPARLAKLTKACVVICGSRLDPISGRYIFTVSEPIAGVDGKDLRTDTLAIAARMEQLIGLSPEQYMWTFRWFRTRPDGEPSPYDPVQQR